LTPIENLIIPLDFKNNSEWFLVIDVVDKWRGRARKMLALLRDTGLPCRDRWERFNLDKE